MPVADPGGGGGGGGEGPLGRPNNHKDHLKGSLLQLYVQDITITYYCLTYCYCYTFRILYALAYITPWRRPAT